MATHSTILAWEILCSEELVHGLTRVGQDLVTKQQYDYQIYVSFVVLRASFLLC